MDDKLELRRRSAGDVTVIYLSGRIDIDGAELIEETGRVLKSGTSKILLHMEQTDVVDYNGLTIIAIAYKNVINQEGAMKFSGVPAHIRKLFSSARLDVVFEVFDDEEQAIKSFAVSTKVDRLLLRRRFKRIDLSIGVSFKKGLRAEDKLKKGTILNIGGEGLFIQTKETFPVSTKIYLELPLGAESEKVIVSGVVIWLADRQLQPHAYPGMGVQLAGLDPKTQESIIAFIDRHITHRSRT